MTKSDHLRVFALKLFSQGRIVQSDFDFEINQYFKDIATAIDDYATKLEAKADVVKPEPKKKTK